MTTTKMLNRFQLSPFRAFALIILCSASAAVAQSPQAKPSPTPRRPLAKPVQGSRGFEQFEKRDASARLIAAGATRGGIETSSHLANGMANYRAGKYEAAAQE